MTAGIGDNSGETFSKASAGRIKSYLARAERLETVKEDANADLKEIYAEAKAEGFDVATLRATVRLRKQDRRKRESREALIALYIDAIGGIDAEL